MRSYQEFFRGKRITLLGLGLLGRGVGDAEFLAQCGADIIVTDSKTDVELAASVAKLKKYPNITFHLGGHQKEDFTNCDMVIKAAGVRLDSPEIAAARAAGAQVAMSTALFAKYARDAGARIVGVTGTRGKSTVAHMIFHALQMSLGLNRAAGAVGRTTLHGKVVLGGNIRGISTLAMLPEIEKGDICVLELDSWQLQGFGDMKMSPHIAVFTNLMPDHQNYYPDMETYFSDKANIFRHQHQGDTLMVGQSVLGRVEAARPPVAPRVPALIPTDWSLKIVGEHNRENASLAAAALSVLGLSQEEIRIGLESFEGVEGRLQFVREVNPFDKLRTGGVKIYNDNNATTPEATIAALRALGKNITLIVGGSEKGLALEELVSEIKKDVSHVILLTHPNYQGSARLAAALKEAGIAFEEARDLPHAVDAAIKDTKTGTILFSPAFASFGMFQNEYERNDQFMEIIRKMGGAV